MSLVPPREKLFEVDFGVSKHREMDGDEEGRKGLITLLTVAFAVSFDEGCCWDP